jgi:ATP-dependent phosphofructokinase / diphosphate-dependent phosphofructokinase
MTTAKKQKMGILTGGGDSAGLNPAIKWVTATALDPLLARERGFEYEILGIMEGWRGLAFTGDYEKNVMPLTESVVSTWDRLGGTSIGTSRYNPFNPKKDTSKLVYDNIEKLGLDVLIAIGGEDTLGVAAKLSKLGVKVVGIPKTIDKDLPETEYSLGFESAVEVITEMVDKLRTTADSHRRVMVVEVMGRTAGWLALKGGESTGAYITLIPEYDFSIDRVNELIKEAKQRGSKYEIVMVAEGAKSSGGKETYKGEQTDSFGHVILGGVGEYLADAISKGTGIETRSVILGHVQRGGAPCAYDRRMGRYFGTAAVNMIDRKQFGKMVCLKNGKITSVDIEKVLGKLSLVDVKTMYDTERYTSTNKILGLDWDLKAQIADIK